MRSGELRQEGMQCFRVFLGNQNGVKTNKNEMFHVGSVIFNFVSPRSILMGLLDCTCTEDNL